MQRSDLRRMPIKRRWPSADSLAGRRQVCCERLFLFRNFELETCQACVPCLPRVPRPSVPEGRRSACAQYFRNSEIDASSRVSSRMLDRVHQMGRQFAAHLPACAGRKTSWPSHRYRKGARTPGACPVPRLFSEVRSARRPPRGKTFNRNGAETPVAPAAGRST